MTSVSLRFTGRSVTTIRLAIGENLYFIDSPLKHSNRKPEIEIRTRKYKRFEAYFAGRKLQVTEVTGA